MANYASFCPECMKIHYTGWGAKKCPDCGVQMYQSRIDQPTFSRYSEEQKCNTFISLVKSPEEAEIIRKIFQSEEEAKEEAKKMAAERKEAIIQEQIKKKEAISNMLISSGFNFEGYRIVKYSGYISGDDATTIPRVSGIFTSQHGQNMTDALVKIRIQALKELKEAAYDLGCNAVIGVDFDYLTLEPERASMLDARTTVKEDYVICVTANGNAVVIEKI